MQCQTQFFPIHWWWSNFFLSAHHSLQVHTLQSYPLYCSSCITPGFLHWAVFTMTEWNSIHRPSWRGKESELFITHNKPLFLLKTNTYNFSLNHFIFWRPHKTTELVRNVTSGQAYNYCNTTSAILPSSLLFSNSSSNIYSSHSAKGARRHVEKLYFKETGVDMSCAGVVLAQKLKYKHIHFTSFSKMRSDVAAQVHFHIPTYDWHSSTNILVYTIRRFSAPQ